MITQRDLQSAQHEDDDDGRSRSTTHSKPRDLYNGQSQRDTTQSQFGGNHYDKERRVIHAVSRKVEYVPHRRNRIASQRGSDEHGNEPYYIQSHAYRCKSFEFRNREDAAVEEQYGGVDGEYKGAIKLSVRVDKLRDDQLRYTLICSKLNSL